MVKILFLDGEQGSKLYQALISEEYNIERFSSEKDLRGAVTVSKPQIVILHEFTPGLANKLLTKYPFVPVVIYGEFVKEKKINKLLKMGAARCLKAPFEKENIIPVIKEVLWRGLAKVELWDNQMTIAVSENRRRIFGNIFTCIVSIGIVIGLITTSKDKIFTVHSRLSPQIYTTPYSNPTGITLYGNALWICDWKTQNIYKHSIDNDFAIKGVYAFPEKRFSCITFAGGYLWSCAPWEKKFYKHKIDKHLEIIASYDSPGPNPLGMDFDGKYIWTCDNATDRIYQLAIDDGLKVVKSYHAPASNPVGIFCDDSNIWTVDSQTNRIYRHKLDGILSVDSVFIPPDYLKLSSIDGDNDYIWICAEKEAKIYKYPKKLLEIIE